MSAPGAGSPHGPADGLAGVWRLVSFHTLAPDGALRPGPLGDSPTGLLFYSGTGHVAVHMSPAGGPHEYLGYAGTWRREGDRVLHTLNLAPRPEWLGSVQVRLLELDGDRLTLTGTALSTAERRVLVWERIGHGAP
ncbi:lipocalin-like domain-containing protein [Streptomyces sp. WMMC905]|uniref:lipocalin-like domain-containing protein n=1 Tax=Streptomyces sp. WMMC905 TaxID=3404123 RepID=UPI003B9507BD